MTFGLLQGKRAWLVAALVGAMLGALAWPFAASALVGRTISMTVVLQGEGPVALRWHHQQGSNGSWIDFDDPVLKAVRLADGSRRWSLAQWLPSYDVTSLAVEPTAGAIVTASDVQVMTRLFGFKLPTRELTPSPDGGTVRLGPLPAAWRDVLLRGVLSCAAIGAAFGLLMTALARNMLWIETRSSSRAVAASAARRPDRDRPSRPLLDVLTVVVCIAIPVLMCLWSPMLMVADSTAYLWFAELLRQTGSFAHFDGWRMPGYGLFLTPFISSFHDFAPPVGIVQCGMGIATSLLVFDMLRRRVRTPWPHIASMVVATDPILLGWQRVVMGESMSALTVTFAAWVFLKIVAPDRTRAMASPSAISRGLLLGLVLGLACGWACLIRGNNQVVPAVLIAALAWCGIVWKRREAFVAVLAALVATVALLVPLCVVNARNHNRFTPAVGRDFTRALFSWENGTTDWNQCGTLSFEEFRQLRSMLRERAMTDWDVLEWLAKTSTVPVPEGASPWLAMDIRSRALVDEAVARSGPKVLKRQMQSAAGLLGIPVTEPEYALNGTWAIFAQLRGEANPRTTTNFDFPIDRFPPYMQEVIGRGVRDISWTKGHPAARVYGLWFDAWRWIRAMVGVLFVCALIRLLAARQWAFAALGLVVLANIVGVPALTYAAEYRYAAPFYPLVAVVVVLGLLSRARHDGSAHRPNGVGADL